MTDHDKFVALALEKKGDGCSIEEVLMALRGAGATIVDSLKVVREVEGVKLGQAKEIVDGSATWADMRAVNERLRDKAARGLIDDCD